MLWVDVSCIAKVRSAGGVPCSTSYDSDSGASILSGNSVNGAFRFAPELKLSRAGDHVLCLWLADSSSDTAPISGPQPVLFSLRRPCIVPAVRKRMKLKRAQKRLGASGCTAGSVRFKRSRWVRRGRVIRFRPGSGKRLAPGAKVVIVVSRGR